MLRIESHRLRILAFATAMVCARAASGQPPPITGLVVDARTNRPLQGVLVYVEHTAAFSETDVDGRFVLEVPEGAHTLVASLIGYAMIEQAVDVRPGAPSEVTIRLSEGAGPFTEHVTVIGRARDEADAAPAGATIRSRELQTVRGLMFDDPLRALQALPSAAATDDFYSELSVRGSTFRHVGFTIDGMPARYLMHTVQATTDSGSTVMFNSDALGAVTLLPGSYPQQLGRHLGAEIDMSSREGSRDDVRARAGLSGTSVTFLGEGPLGQTRGSWLASARHSYLDYLVKRLDDETFAFGFTDAQTKIAYDLSPRHQLQFLAVGGESSFDEPPEDLAANDVAHATSRSWLSGLTWRYSPSARFVLSQRLYVTGVEFTNRNRTGVALDTGDEADLGWRADASIAAGTRWRFELGGDGKRLSGSRQQRRRLDGAADAVVVSEYDARGRAASAYGQATFSPSPGISVTPGARVDYWALTDTVASSPWLTAAVAVGPRTQLRAGTGVYRQFPEFAQVFGIHGGGLALRPERAAHVDAGILQTLAGDITLQFTWYSRNEDDVLWTPGAEPRRLSDGSIQLGRGDARWTNTLEGRARGVEVLLRRSAPAGLSGWVGYAYGRLPYTDAAGGETFWADADQRQTITVFGNYRLSNRTNLSGKFRLGSNYPIVGYIGEQEPPPGAPRLLGGGAPVFLALAEDRNTLRLPAYARLDLRADRIFNWSTRRITLFAEVINLLNRTNARNVPYGIDRSGRVTGATDSLMPILPSVGFVIEF